MTSIKLTARRTARLNLLVIAGVIAAMSACGAKPSDPPAGPADPARAAAPSDLNISPVARSVENGLEAAWWVVTSSDAEISRALADFLTNPLPLDPAVAAVWEANGLRVVTVPFARLDELQARLTISGAIQRQWLGQAPVWTDAISGPSWSGSRTLALDSGRLALGPGRLRLLTRCWTVPVPVAASEPDPSPAAALHIELLLQHYESDRADRSAIPTEMPAAIDPLDAGLVFRRLLAEMTVGQGDAYLILPFHPGQPWDASDPATADPILTAAPPGLDTPSPDPEPIPRLGEVRRAGVSDLVTPTAAPSLSPVGPPETPVVTLGEALLTSQGIRPPTTSRPADRTDSPHDRNLPTSWRAERPARAVLILIPRVPDRFRLIE